MHRKLAHSFRLLSAAAVLAAGAALAPPASAAAPVRPATAQRAAERAADNPYQRGPAPTEASITAEKGPFAIETIPVPAGSGTGFNKGTVYAPTDMSQGTFGAIVVSPGFVSPEAWISWYGPRLASQGFVVMTLETDSLFDVPASRGDQLLAALDWLTGKSSVKNRIDATRTAVMGHSMGGGGTLEAANKRPSLKADIPLAPWDMTYNFPDIKTPTLIMGADNDFIAPAASMAETYYNNLKTAPEKAYLLLKNAGHMTFVSPNTTIAKYSIAWMKRFVDNDARYDRFLCPAPAPSATIAKYLDTCPTG
ncbi:dienelactone hydrolase family protein [Actinomadura violacea]|uniref:poly(ethylene terephthalate) hydrolase n=1 Tax=Actinomadura violacea TaxID=2819934 RepID=A0ABS3RIL7_9ACTN|nr:dienelactone hydrolase family protein [Actinomadura violacea]MBO2456188.1 dienelactone hydrolase family protein [Actinomadura violacea]